MHAPQAGNGHPELGQGRGWDRGQVAFRGAGHGASRGAGRGFDRGRGCSREASRGRGASSSAQPNAQSKPPGRVTQTPSPCTKPQTPAPRPKADSEPIPDRTPPYWDHAAIQRYLEEVDQEAPRSAGYSSPDHDAVLTGGSYAKDYLLNQDHDTAFQAGYGTFQGEPVFPAGYGTIRRDDGAFQNGYASFGVFGSEPEYQIHGLPQNTPRGGLPHTSWTSGRQAYYPAYFFHPDHCAAITSAYANYSRQLGQHLDMLSVSGSGPLPTLPLTSPFPPQPGSRVTRHHRERLGSSALGPEAPLTSRPAFTFRSHLTPEKMAGLVNKNSSYFSSSANMPTGTPPIDSKLDKLFDELRGMSPHCTWDLA